jgi:Sulfotransferase family
VTDRPIDAAPALVFPFIVGSGRSGTTLLRAILDSHPELAIPDEVSFIVRLSRPHYAARYGWPRRFRTDQCVELLLANGSLRRWGMPPEEIRSAVLGPPAAPATSFAEAVRRLYRRFAERQGKARYGDKTPMHVLYLGRLGRMFPEARFVHLVRDGRDVALSYLDAAWGPATVEEAAVEWRRRVAAGRRAGRRLGPGRYVEVRYEDLAADPEPVVRRLCEFTTLSWDDRLLRHQERADQVIDTTRFPESHQRLRLPPTPGLRDWRNDMDLADVARFEAIAGSQLEAFGYEVVTGRAGGLDRLRAERLVAAAFASRSWTAAVTGGRVLVGR